MGRVHLFLDDVLVRAEQCQSTSQVRCTDLETRSHSGLHSGASVMKRSVSSPHQVVMGHGGGGLRLPDSVPVPVMNLKYTKNEEQAGGNESSY